MSAKPSPQRWNLWRSFQQYNQMVEEFAQDRPNLRYLDIGETLLGADGRPDLDLFTEDKLHINGKGYKRWVELLNPIVVELYQKSLDR